MKRRPPAPVPVIIRRLRPRQSASQASTSPPSAQEPAQRPLQATSTALVTRGPALPPAKLDDAVRELLSHAKAENTREAYRKAFAGFAAWCRESGAPSLPSTPDTVVRYLTARMQAGKKYATIALDLSAINSAHGFSGHPAPGNDPYVKEAMASARRVLGTAQRQVAPLMPKQLQRVCSFLPLGLLGARDRAILLLGFCGAFRRSELVALTVADLTFSADGLVVLLRRSKTDQEARGQTKGIPPSQDGKLCPVRAVKNWLEWAKISEGPLFREVTRYGTVGSTALTDHSIAKMVKRSLVAAGIDPAPYSGHSLRAGFATAAAEEGLDGTAIQRQTGHKSLEMLNRYVRRANLFKNNAASGLLDSANSEPEAPERKPR